MSEAKAARLEASRKAARLKTIAAENAYSGFAARLMAEAERRRRAGRPETEVAEVMANAAEAALIEAEAAAALIKAEAAAALIEAEAVAAEAGP